MVTFTLFIVDDEPGIRTGVSIGLKRDYQVRTFADAESAIHAMASETPDLVLLDIGLPGMSGAEALTVIRRRWPDVLVIMVTAYEDIETVIRVMKQGAHDYIVKPIHMESLKNSVKNALETIRMRKEIQALQERYLTENLPCFIGESNAIQDVMRFVEKVAKSPDAPVLILGESGTGKELIAGAIHYKSPNYKGPFVTINCASIPRELIESELFGYERGAFSGASASGKKGMVEQAAGGTLFMDEVGDLDLTAQAKLLRFLEEGEYYRVGGTRKLRVSTRVLSATNKNLEAMVQDGNFREDLYYRLAVITVRIPALNDRRDDIVPIAIHFLSEFGRKYGKAFTGFSEDAEAFLLRHDWKGNIREMRNLSERGVLVGDPPLFTPAFMTGLSAPAACPPAETIQPFGPIPDAGIDLEALERHYLREALARSGGNDAEAARLLRMSYYSFRYRKKKLESGGAAD